MREALEGTVKGKTISFAHAYLYIFIVKAIKLLLSQKYMPYIIEVIGKKVEA